MVQFLISEGADPTIVDNRKNDPITDATNAGRADVVKFIVSNIGMTIIN